MNASRLFSLCQVAQPVLRQRLPGLIRATKITRGALWTQTTTLGTTQEDAHVRHFSVGKSMPQKVENTQISTTEFKYPAQIAKEERDTEQDELATKKLAELSAEDERKLKIIQLEYDVLMSMGNFIPEEMTNIRWLILLEECLSASSRRKKYTYWAKTDWSKKNQREKKMKQKAESGIVDDKRGELINCFIPYVREGSMNKHYYNNLAHAMCYGQELVFDFGFHKYMTEHEQVRLVQQFLGCHGANKKHKDPFHMVLCNIGPQMTQQYKRLLKLLDGIPLTITEENYLDLFPKEKLVYLSPNARQSLTHFSHDDVYIIGGIVDMAGEEPLTLAKAKKEGIRCVKLPLDKHLRWAKGSKSLTLNHVVQILLEIKSDPSNDWVNAFQHVPSRKLSAVGPDQHILYTPDFSSSQQRFSNKRQSPVKKKSFKLS